MRRTSKAFGTVAALALVAAASMAPAVSRDNDSVDTHFGTYTDWSKWQRVTNNPFDFRGCGTTVTATWPVDRAFQRTRTDPYGNVYIDFKGVLKTRLTAKDGRRSELIDTSGIAAPGGAVSYKNGDFLYDALGANLTVSSRAQDRLPGLPRNFVSQGPFTALYHPDAKAELLREPQHWISVCRLLDGAHQLRGNPRTGGYTDWGGWQNGASGDSEWARGCDTQVKFKSIKDTLKFRSRQDSRGNDYFQLGNGVLSGRFVSKDGRQTERLDLSGETAPGGVVVYKDGTDTKPHFMSDLLGVNYVLPEAIVGVDPKLPRLFVSYGPATAVSENNELHSLRYPQEVVSICRLLDGGRVPWDVDD
jgi:hypothetical protein